jgi:hypothetical protein
MTSLTGILYDEHFRPLTCRFAPPAGLEPATYGLEVDPRPSTPSRVVPSLLGRSGGSSSRCAPVGPSDARWNDRGNDRRAPLVREFLAAGSGYAVRNALGTETNHTGNDPPHAGSWQCRGCPGC